MDLLRVLWQPRQTASRIAEGKVRLLLLLLLWLLLDGAASLMLYPFFVESTTKAMLTHPEITPGMKGFVLAVALLFTTLSNLVFSLFAALVLFFATLISKGKSSYRKILEVLLIGSAPTLFYRFIRSFLYVVGVTHTVRQNAVPLRTFMPSGWHGLVQTVGSVDLIDLWSLGLVAYAFSRISGLRAWLSVTMVVALWLVMQALLIRVQTSGGL